MPRIVSRGMTRTTALASIVVLSVAAAAPGQRVSKSGVNPERLAAVRARMQSFVRRGAVAGAVTLIARRGEVVSLEAFGYQDLESRRPMRADTFFDIRSVTKPVTAVGIMILMEEGRLSLSDPVDKYIPG